MTDPLDQGFELDGVLFGQSGDVLVESFTPGGYEVRSQDADGSNRDVRYMGRDRKSPGTWAWSLGINRSDEDGTYETLEALQAAWDPETSQTPGAFSTLRYRVNGRTRRIYGRPRRFTPVLDVRRLGGYAGIEADFSRVDLLHYDDEEQVVVVGLQPASGSGFLAPFEFPLSSLADTVGRSGQITVGGTVPTPVIIEIAGDVTSPWVQAVDLWNVRLETDIDADTYVTIDARQWVQSAVRDSGGSVAGALRGSTFVELVLPPGDNEIVFGGLSVSGDATATVRWRAAYKSL